MRLLELSQTVWLKCQPFINPLRWIGLLIVSIVIGAGVFALVTELLGARDPSAIGWLLLRIAIFGGLWMHLRAGLRAGSSQGNPSMWSAGPPAP